MYGRLINKPAPSRGVRSFISRGTRSASSHSELGEGCAESSLVNARPPFSEEDNLGSAFDFDNSQTLKPDESVVIRVCLCDGGGRLVIQLKPLIIGFVFSLVCGLNVFCVVFFGSGLLIKRVLDVITVHENVLNLP